MHWWPDIQEQNQRFLKDGRRIIKITGKKTRITGKEVTSKAAPQYCENSSM
jgi:hypothetical protein